MGSFLFEVRGDGGDEYHRLLLQPDGDRLGGVDARREHVTASSRMNPCLLRNSLQISSIFADVFRQIFGDLMLQ